MSDILTPEVVSGMRYAAQTANDGEPDGLWQDAMALCNSHEALRDALAEAEADLAAALKHDEESGEIVARVMWQCESAIKERDSLRLALDANADQLAQEIATARTLCETLCEQRNAALYTSEKLREALVEAAWRRMFARLWAAKVGTLDRNKNE